MKNSHAHCKEDWIHCTVKCTGMNTIQLLETKENHLNQYFSINDKKNCVHCALFPSVFFSFNFTICSTHWGLTNRIDVSANVN